MIQVLRALARLGQRQFQRRKWAIATVGELLDKQANGRLSVLLSNGCTAHAVSLLSKVVAK